MSALVIRGDARRLPLPDVSVDAIVCDPPYGLEFMGKEWDSFGRGEARSMAVAVAAQRGGHSATNGRPTFLGGLNPRCRTCGCSQRGGSPGVCVQPDFTDGRGPRLRAFQAWCETWAAEALRVLKPGGHLLAFGGTRTYHRLTCAIEDAGFEIRDSIGVLGWVYASGFPKSRNVHADTGREQDRGWGTALKPAWEPIVVARKPLAGTVAGNVLAYGTGAINVGACRVDAAGGRPNRVRSGEIVPRSAMGGGPMDGSRAAGSTDLGRWPTNLVLVHHPDCADPCVPGCPVAELDAQSGTSRSAPRLPTGRDTRGIPNGNTPVTRFADTEERGHADSGGASRFYPTFRFNPKADTWERPTLSRSDGTVFAHPTVKPVDLMRWLVRMVTPPGGVVLDPFVGSGATLQAAQVEGFRSVGVELDADHCALIRQRLSWPVRVGRDGEFQRIRPVPALSGQGDLFSELGGGAA